MQTPHARRIQPTEFGQLTALQDLGCGLNSLHGQLPTELGRLVRLVTFGVGGNQFAGAIPTQLGAWVLLTQLKLDTNALAGTVPASFAGLNSVLSATVFGNGGLCGTKVAIGPAVSTSYDTSGAAFALFLVISLGGCGDAARHLGQALPSPELLDRPYWVERVTICTV